MLSGANRPYFAYEEPLAARPVQPNVLADKNIGLDIEPEKQKQENQYKDVLDKKHKSNQTSALLPKMARVINNIYLINTHNKRTDFLKQSRSTQIFLLEMKTAKVKSMGIRLLIVILNSYLNRC